MQLPRRIVLAATAGLSAGTLLVVGASWLLEPDVDVQAPANVTNPTVREQPSPPSRSVGLFIVGVDIEPGTYHYMVDNWRGGSWERLTCLTPPGEPECVVEKSPTGSSSTGGYVTVQPGDVGLRVYGLTLLREQGK